MTYTINTLVESKTFRARSVLSGQSFVRDTQ